MTDLYGRLALIYVDKNANAADPPEKLLAMYREAYDKVMQCDKEHQGKTFSFE